MQPTIISQFHGGTGGFYFIGGGSTTGDGATSDRSLRKGSMDAGSTVHLIPRPIGHAVPSTLKLAGSINGQEVIILVDGGSTNNFIQSGMAAHLNLVMQPSMHTWVTVGNGDTLTCGGECSAVPLKVGDTIFTIDLILLPIYGAYLVLAVQWLLQLGPVLFDYKHLWMEFSFQGKTSSTTWSHSTTFTAGQSYLSPHNSIGWSPILSTNSRAN